MEATGDASLRAPDCNALRIYSSFRYNRSNSFFVRLPFGLNLCLFPTQLRGSYLPIVSYSLDIRSLFVRYSATHRLPSPTPFNAKIGFALFALSALFAKNVVSLCRFFALSLFFFFVRETVETLRLSHISLSFTISYKVSSEFQSLKVPSIFFFSIAT